MIEVDNLEMTYANASARALDGDIRLDRVSLEGNCQQIGHFGAVLDDQDSGRAHELTGAADGADDSGQPRKVHPKISAARFRTFNLPRRLTLSLEFAGIQPAWFACSATSGQCFL